MKKSIICGMISVMVIVLVSSLVMHQVNLKSSSLLLSNVEALTNDEENGYKTVYGDYKEITDPDTNTVIKVAYLVCTGIGKEACSLNADN